MNAAPSLEFSTDFDQEELLKAEQVRLLYEAMPASIIATLINATILVIIEWEVIEHTVLIGWLVSLLIITAARTFITVAYNRAQSEPQETSRWESFFVVGSISAGFVWGSAALILFPEDSIAHQVFLVFIIGGMCAGAVTSLSPLRITVLSFIFLSLSPIIVQFLMVGSEMSITMGITLLLYLFLISSNAIKGYQNIVQNILLRLESAARENAIRKSEASLRESESRLSQSQHIAHLGGWEWDINSGKLYWSDETYRIFGLEPQEIEESYEKFIEYIHPDDRELVQESIRKAVEENVPYNIDHRIALADGRERFVNEEGRVLFNESGQAVRMSGTVRDITEHKKVEEQLFQSQKMEAIGTLVGGIAHDFNNTLAAIQGNLYLAKKKMDEKDTLNTKLDNIEQLSEHAADMVQQLLTFARKDRVSTRPFSLTSFMTEGFKLSKNIIPESVNYSIDLCDEELIIHGDATQLQQALMNLLNNARDAVRDTKQPRIVCTLESFSVDADFQQGHPEIKGERVAHLVVKDNGCGISEDALAQIFVPFFTTKGVGEGTGLGLAMVYGSVQTHGGAIEVDSREGEGTAFHLYLPLYTGEEKSVEKPKESIVPGEGENILLVDDETGMREAVGEVLTSLGYRVLSAADGEEAVELFKADADGVSLVVTDVVMPKMGGIDAVKQMRLLNSEVPVIFATGYDKDQSATSREEIERSITISKPFSFETLSQSIRTMIDPN